MESRNLVEDDRRTLYKAWGSGGPTKNRNLLNYIEQAQKILSCSNLLSNCLLQDKTTTNFIQTLSVS